MQMIFPRSEKASLLSDHGSEKVFQKVFTTLVVDQIIMNERFLANRRQECIGMQCLSIHGSLRGRQVVLRAGGDSGGRGGGGGGGGRGEAHRNSFSSD